MAESISVGPWTVAATLDASGRLSIEVRLCGEPHSELNLRPLGTAEERRRSKIETDMDY